MSVCAVHDSGRQAVDDDTVGVMLRFDLHLAVAGTNADKSGVRVRFKFNTMGLFPSMDNKANKY